jgi:hypothetical protein
MNRSKNQVNTPERVAERQLERRASRIALAKLRYIREVYTADLNKRAAAVQRFVLAIFDLFLYEIAVYAADPKHPGEINPKCIGMAASYQETIIAGVLPRVLRSLPEGLRRNAGLRIERLLDLRVAEFKELVKLGLIDAEERRNVDQAERANPDGRRNVERGTRRASRRSEKERQTIREIQGIVGLTHYEICQRLDRQGYPLPKLAHWKGETWSSAYRQNRSAVAKWITNVTRKPR